MTFTKPKHFPVRLSIIEPLLLLLLSTACLQEVDVELPENESQLVVEGFINSLGEVQVRLTSTADFTKVKSSALSGATVEIIETNGPTLSLVELSPGLHLNTSAEVAPEVGKSYQLRIVLKSGEEYVSSVETILEPLEITDDSVGLKKTTLDVDGTTGRSFYSHEVTVTVRNTQEDHYYYLSNQGWEQVQVWYNTFACFGVPWPGPDVCWLFRDPISEDKIAIGSNLEIGGRTYSILADDIPFRGPRQYIAFVNVNSISAENYAFWQKVNDQLTRENGIFDKPFAPIVGNIKGVNTSKVALGYFHAYGTTRQTVCFDRFDVPVAFNYPLAPCDLSCTAFYSFTRSTDLNLQEFFCQ